MNCPECKTKITDPTIVGDTAYFVCTKCGHCLTKSVSEINKSTTDLIHEFENEYSVTLPEAYKDFINKNKHIDFEEKIIKISSQTPPELEYYTTNGYLSINDILGVKRNDNELTIFDSKSLSEEWQLPEKLVLISGDGHAWIALDYRQRNINPPVIFIETDEYKHINIADNFETLLTNWIENNIT